MDILNDLTPGSIVAGVISGIIVIWLQPLLPAPNHKWLQYGLIANIVLLTLDAATGYGPFTSNRFIDTLIAALFGSMAALSLCVPSIRLQTLAFLLPNVVQAGTVIALAKLHEPHLLLTALALYPIAFLFSLPIIAPLTFIAIYKHFKTN